MTERLSISEFEEKCGYFDENYAEIMEKVALSAQRSGRKAEDVIVLAATKTVSVEVINYAIEKGISYIGENRVQEFLSKNESYNEVHKHFIGHLQTNKVKDIIGKVEMIESVDSHHLAKEISKQSQKRGLETDILLEVNIGNEESKSGFSAENLEEELRKIAALPAIHIRGLMAIPPICEKDEEICAFFEKMHNLFVDIKHKNIDNSSMEFLSMGMSSDYALAIEKGANIVRIGTSLFGKRNYQI